MSLKCKIFGHKYRVRNINVLRMLETGSLIFDNERYHKAYELTRKSSIDPEKEYICNRCGHVESGYTKFLMHYMFL